MSTTQPQVFLTLHNYLYGEAPRQTAQQAEVAISRTSAMSEFGEKRPAYSVSLAHQALGDCSGAVCCHVAIFGMF